LKGNIVITGGNGGIGAAMAEILCARGYGVKIVCRSRPRAEAFIRSMEAKGLRGIELIEGDLGSMKGAREAAARIRAECPGFAVFVHNAAIWPTEKLVNEDGLEQSFVTNHMAPFILNLLLEDLFRKNRCRVVQVSAGLYIAGVKDCRSTATGENFSLLKTYPTTKLLNLIATMEFAKRVDGSGVTVNALHPGVVRTGLGDMKGVGGAVMRLLKHLWLSPVKGAAAPVYLATDPGLEGVSGRYFNRFRMEELKDVARDPEFAREVWRQALDLGGFKE
jgi:NAD(P)-dependent dehydrogenase (short-subunit alcohol dehydrogenase family)